MSKITDLPAPNDIDADYAPQYIQLARIIRDKITSGEHAHGTRLPGTTFAAEHGVSAAVALRALETLAANGYVRQQGRFGSYFVTWQEDT